MHVNELPAPTQDILKALWDISERSGEPVSLGELAHQTGRKASTTSEAVKRLAADGLVEHAKYSGVTLTAEGRRLATQMVRRHRLVETFLVDVLGYTWDEVHDDAESLEHSLSDKFVERLAAHLGNPPYDPHGDPIPSVDGHVEPLPGEVLAGITGRAQVRQVNDRDPELLRYLSDQGIGPGALIEVEAPVAGITRLHVETAEGGREAVLAESALRDIRVDVISTKA